MANSPQRWALAALAASLTLGVAAAATPQEVPGREAAAITPAEAKFLLARLAKAADEGLDTSRWGLETIESGLNSSNPDERAAAQAALTSAALAFARAEHGGQTPTDAFPETWAIRPDPSDPASGFSAAVVEHKLAAWADAQAPADPRYAQLVAARVRYARIDATGGWQVIAVPRILKEGGASIQIARLRRRMAIEDPAAAPVSDDPVAWNTWDAPFTEAIRRAQGRYGLDVDGVPGPALVAALNIPVSERLDQIDANLERWRWMPRLLPTYRAELNIAAAALTLFEPDGNRIAMRAIVGRPDRQTPMFEDRIRAVIFNPPWMVPADIAAREIWPKIRKDPGYMAREGFVVRPGGGLEQLPGPRCALGVLKFDLTNPFGVYLHDTPTRNLFRRSDRDLSHGCMRLQDPKGLAARLLRDDPDWPATRIDATLESGATVRVPLRDPVPLFVVYWTATADVDGEAAFFPDTYRWDERLRRLRTALLPGGSANPS